MMRRMFVRFALVTGALFLVAATSVSSAPAPYPIVTAGRSFAFPADHGSHPDYRTEWWYATGTVRGTDGAAFGFQVTFFRVRPRSDAANPSAFAARQIMFAHVAVSDVRTGRLYHDSRAARAGLGIAGARTDDGDATIRDWRIVRQPNGLWQTRIVSRDFAFDVVMRPTQPPMLQGNGGYSRKGPQPAQASYYYSIPQMATRGEIRVGKTIYRVSGKAWLDREWSSSYLDPSAVGWDWTGLNFDDGGALMLFRIRRPDGANLWAGGSYRDPRGRVTVLAPGDIAFRTLRRWRSARTGAVYPVAQSVSVKLPQGTRTLTLKPLFDDQEIDARRSGLPVYWEGAVTAEGATGYLELTGYVAPLKM